MLYTISNIPIFHFVNPISTRLLASNSKFPNSRSSKISNRLNASKTTLHLHPLRPLVPFNLLPTTFEESEKEKRKKESYSTVTLQTVSRVEKTIHARAILPQVSRVGPGAPYRTSTSRSKVGGRRVSGLTPREIESKGVDG